MENLELLKIKLELLKIASNYTSDLNTTIAYTKRLFNLLEVSQSIYFPWSEIDLQHPKDISKIKNDIIRTLDSLAMNLRDKSPEIDNIDNKD